MPRDDEFVGFEFDWLGVDQHDFVAAFIAWGGGMLPAGVAQHADEVNTAMEHIEELPVVGPTAMARYEATGPHPGPDGLTIDANGDNFLFWDQYAAKGFYVYHWDDERCSYDRYSAPPVLLTVSQLPAELQAIAHFAEFTLTFADTHWITLGSAGPRAQPDRGGR